MERAYRKVVHDHAGSKAAALQTRIGMDHGIEEAAHLAIRTSLDDLGRLGHNLATAVAYSEAATTLGLPRGLVPLANLGHVQAVSLQGVPPIDIPSLAGPGPGKPDVELLGRLLEDWEFERVEEILRALAFEGNADAAYRPLLVAASADFYGQCTVGEQEHTISSLNAVLQTAKFLGREEALLPLAIGLSKLPF